MVRRKKNDEAAVIEAAEGIPMVVGDTDSTEFVERTSNRTSKYAALGIELSKLLIGKSIVLTPPVGCGYDQFKGRIQGAINTLNVSAPDGAKFRQRKTTNGALAISCVAD